MLHMSKLPVTGVLDSSVLGVGFWVYVVVDIFGMFAPHWKDLVFCI